MGSPWSSCSLAFWQEPKSLTKVGPHPKSGPAASGPKTTPFFPPSMAGAGRRSARDRRGDPGTNGSAGGLSGGVGGPATQGAGWGPSSNGTKTGHPVNGEVGTWFGAFRIPNLVPRSLVNIVGCSSRGRGNCGKLRATSNWASKPVIRSFPSAVRTVEKQLRALASSPPELVVFPRFA